MPLIDLQTNLRDLTFGRDRVAGDSSKQPFIQTKLPGINESLQTFISVTGEETLSQATEFSDIDLQLQLPISGTGGTDFILRGGTLLFNRIEKDVKRLFKFFASPNGVNFFAKQNLLSRLSVRTQASGIFLNDGLYTQLSTLTSAAGIAFGISVNKQLPALQNISTLKKNPTRGRYESEVYERETGDEWKKNSRLFQLQNSIITGKTYRLGGIGPENFKIGGIKLNPDAKLFEKFKGNILLKYDGGPDAFLGTIGNTNIRFASERASDAKPAPKGINDKYHSTLKPSDVPLVNINALNIKQQSNPSIMDFRGRIKYSDSTKNIEGRLNLGSPGKPKTIINGINVHPRHDKINALPLYQSEKVKPNDLSFPTTDIIPFRIGVINNDNPTLKTYIHFRAFLDNISDSYKADWKKQNYIGRGEDFFTYSGFDRTVSLGWTVVAQSKEELIPMYKKLNYLASVIMPDYSTAGYMRGNMVTLTVGGYFNEQPGIITGFSFDMNDDKATWEIGINESGKEDNTTSQLPHLIKVKGFNFTPIHTFVPRLQQNIFGTAETDATTKLPKVTKGINGGDDVEYGKEHFIALTTNNSFNGGNRYTIDDQGSTIAEDEAAAAALAALTSQFLSQTDFAANQAALAEYEAAVSDPGFNQGIPLNRD